MSSTSEGSQYIFAINNENTENIKLYSKEKHNG